MDEQPVPAVGPDDVARVVRRDFPAGAVDAALAILGGYGDVDRDRTRLAALKIAGGDLDRLRRAVAVAARDFRDVLVAAEYPRYWAAVSAGPSPPDGRQAIIEADWREYREWLDR